MIWVQERCSIRAAYGLAREPLIVEALEAGADLVTFSGDKLLGGPQAGVIVGSAAAVEPIARRPLARALRPDKMTIAALRATLGHYLRGEAAETVPVWQMIAAGNHELRERAERISAGVAGVRLVNARAAVGGGSLPGQTLPSVAIEVLKPRGGAEALARHLRAASRPVDWANSGGPSSSGHEDSVAEGTRAFCGETLQAL